METFIQPKITGYRQLTADEAALMNEGKALAEQCGAYIAKLRGYVPKDVNEKLESGEIGEYKVSDPTATKQPFTIEYDVTKTSFADRQLPPRQARICEP